MKDVHRTLLRTAEDLGLVNPELVTMRGGSLRVIGLVDGLIPLPFLTVSATPSKQNAINRMIADMKRAIRKARATAQEAA